MRLAYRSKKHSRGFTWTEQTMTKLFIVRHAQATGNQDKRFQGSTDNDISAYGRLQLAALSERCHRLPLDRIYTSPLRRAVETAKAVGAGRRLAILERQELREIDCGVWEGMTWDTIRCERAAEFETWVSKPHEFQAPGGEAMRSVFSRMNHILGEILEDNPGGCIAIVSHGCAIRNLMCRIHGLPFEQLSQTPWMEHAAITAVEDSAAGLSIVFENDIQHLQKIKSYLA